MLKMTVPRFINILFRIFSRIHSNKINLTSCACQQIYHQNLFTFFPSSFSQIWLYFPIINLPISYINGLFPYAQTKLIIFAIVYCLLRTSSSYASAFCYSTLYFLNSRTSLISSWCFFRSCYFFIALFMVSWSILIKPSNIWLSSWTWVWRLEISSLRALFSNLKLLVTLWD